jgi:hypothetical protein
MQATHFGSLYFLTRILAKQNLFFVCPILELKLIVLDFVDVVLVDVET